MKDFFSLKNLKMLLGFATGFMTYDYFAHGEIDWIRAIVTAIFASIITVLFFNKPKK